MTNDAPQVSPQEWYKFDDTLICGEFDGYTDNIATISPRKSRQERTMNGDFILKACQSYAADRATIAQQAAQIAALRKALEGLYSVVVEREQGNNDLAEELDEAEAALETTK